MKIRSFLIGATLLLPLGAMAAPINSPIRLHALPSAAAGRSARFTVPSETQVPGQLLSAGSYSIVIVDRLSDRMVVRLEGAGQSPVSFLALPKSGLSSTGEGPILAKGASDHQAALRGFTFPDGTVAEFVFPKAEAVSLAKANDVTFPAIDPESEGRPAAASLSKDDMQMVTLWMLTPVEVGPNDSTASIKAARYEQAGVVRTKTPAKPLLPALPHTANETPWTLVAGAWLLLGAIFFSAAGRIFPGARRILFAARQIDRA